MNSRVLQYILFIWFILIILGAFLYSPPVKDLGDLGRNIYFHVPTAWISVLAFLIGAIYSILYLRSKRIKYDLYAESANQLGFIFCFLALITGSIWAKFSWGDFWTLKEDSRQLTIVVLVLIYAAYFALRSAVEQEEKKAALAAVYTIIAFVTVPFLVFIIPRSDFFGSKSILHPDVIGEAVQAVDKKEAMGPKILVVFLSSLAGFTALFYWMLKMKIDLALLKLKMQRLEN